MRTVRIASAVALAGLVLVLATACVAGLGKGADGSLRPVFKVGASANETVAAIDKAEAAGEISPQSGDDVFGAILNVLGYVLLGGGTVAGGYAGVKTVAKRAVKAYDAEPFEGQWGERVSEADLVQTAQIADAVATDALSATDELKARLDKIEAPVANAPKAS